MTEHDIEQRSDEWYALRATMATASQFERVVTPAGKPSSQQLKYIAEILVGRREEADGGVQTPWMQRGIDMEDEAREEAAFILGVDLRQTGFVVEPDGRYGCSPDAIDPDGCPVQIKCPKPENHLAWWFEWVDSNKGLPKEHAPQVHGEILVLRAPHAHFVSYCPGYPTILAKVVADDYTNKVATHLSDFCDRLERCRELLNAELGEF